MIPYSIGPHQEDSPVADLVHPRQISDQDRARFERYLARS